MKFFIDTAEVNEIREAAALGILDGVTTNPSLIAKSGRAHKDVIVEICSLVSGPVSVEVTADDAPTMLAQADERQVLHAWQLQQLVRDAAPATTLSGDGPRASSP